MPNRFGSSKRLRWLGYLAAGAALVVVGGQLVYPTMSDLWATWEREDRLEREIEALEKENAELEKTIGDLGPDGPEIERIAREDLNWAEPGQVVIKIPEKE